MASIFHGSASLICSSVFEISTSALSNEALLFPSRPTSSSVLAASTRTKRVNRRLQIGCGFSRGGYRNFGYRSRAGVGNSRDLQSAAVPTSVPVRVAHELLQAGHRYLDVRTPEEFSGGHVPGAINVPYMYRVGSEMAKNPEFLAEVACHFGKDDEILIGCQLGKRSFMAATDLHSAGYTGITDVSGGYSAWTQNQLPVSS